jgi:hypothetical protein
MDLQEAFAIPFNVVDSLRDALNTTELENATVYWHIHLTKKPAGLSMLLPKKGEPLSLEPYEVPFA